MEKEREIQEDFYEELASGLEMAMGDAIDHGIVFDPYTGVLTVESYSDDGTEITETRHFRLVPCKKGGAEG